MYTDEKHPEGELVEIYEVVPVIEADQPKPKRPLWRRFIRIFLAMWGVSMLWSAFAPIHHCHHHRRPSRPITHLPTHAIPITMDKPKMEYKFGALKDFKVEQGSLSILPSLVDVFGKIVVGSDEKADGITVTFDIGVSDDGLWDKIKIEPRQDGIYFAADAVVLVRQSVNITAHVVVPSGKDHIMETFQVESRELNVKLLPSFKTMVNASYFETTSGNITSYGGYKDVLYSKYLSAKSGSGNIYGRFGLGNGLELETATGHIKANVSTAPFEGKEAKLSTTTGTGNNSVVFATDLHGRPLTSKHVSAAGSIYVHYPGEWEGKLKAFSVSGDIHVLGEGTKVVKKENKITGRYIKAIKGKGASVGDFKSVGGDIAVSIGKCA